MKSTLSLAVAVTVTVTAAALMSAPVAVANTESQFLDELNVDHATLPGKTSAEMIAAGYATCDHLKGGTSVQDEMSSVNRRYSFDQGVIFVSAATTNLCPNFASQQQSHAQRQKHPDSPDS